MEWKHDKDLEDNLNKYVRENLQRNEILDFMQRDYPNYPWSLRTLDRRLRHFEINYVNYNVTVDEVKKAVKEQLEGPGQLLGYRAMVQKIRQQHGLKIPRHLVYSVMQELDEEGLHNRRPGVKKRKRKGHFVSIGPNWTMSMDGHDKLMGFQNSTFPLAIYGAIDTASRKILMLKIWTTNSEPRLVARWYLDLLYASKVLPHYIRVDKGTETTAMTTIHAFLRGQQGDLDDATDSVIYGPSPSNQIERWWRELHERLEKYYKVGLCWLKEEGYYNPSDATDRLLLSFVVIPIMQKELDEFKDTIWNSHRIRAQKNTYMADGVPNHIYSFPERYGMEKCGFHIANKDLDVAAQLSGAINAASDYIPTDARKKLEAVVNTEHITPANFVQTYLFLKEGISLDLPSQ